MLRRAGGEIGRRTTLRTWPRKGWRFESSPAHKTKELPTPSTSGKSDFPDLRKVGLSAFKIYCPGVAEGALVCVDIFEMDCSPKVFAATFMMP